MDSAAVPGQTPVTQAGDSSSQSKDSADVYDELSNSVGLLSLNAAAEPYFLGSTSGFSLARMVHAILSSSFSAASTEQLDVSPRHPQSLFQLGNDWAAVEQAGAQLSFPPKHISEQLVAMYINRIHSRYPVLDKMALLQTCERREELDPSIPSDCMKLFAHHMVIAIGARNFELISSPLADVVPEAHYAAALRYLDAPLQVHGLESVQALLLLAIFSVRTSGSSGTLGGWHVLGLAMRMAVELGLHRKSKPRDRRFDPYQRELRKRVFWTAYILDRTLCITLGRPFAVAEHEIDVELPIDIPDTIKDPSTILALERSPPPVPNPHPTSLSSFIHMIRLCRIESRIQRFIYGTDASWASNPDDPIFDVLLQELAEWKATIPFPREISQLSTGHDIDRRLYESQEFFEVFYAKAVQLLLRPRISALTKSGTLQAPDSSPRPGSSHVQVADSRAPSQDRYLALCARAAGDVCQYYKRLHQYTSVGYSLLSLNSVFTAGMMLLYCMWATLGRAFSSTAVYHPNWSNDIRACSSVLFVIAERSPPAKRYRDAFEVLASRMIDMMSHSHGHDSGYAAGEDDPNLAFNPALALAGDEQGSSMGAGQPIYAPDGGAQLLATINNILGTPGGTSSNSMSGETLAPSAVLDEQVWDMMYDFLGDDIGDDGTMKGSTSN
ncbi:hypothetical protein A1O1_06088 [Capronia coronata CBS 617.96]|uniref:Xylanolytic transcriptional activator regulatory domain-containing protein n=1 Tax=Capronia coronata CBS 617.96 TaxID=1182541 RepID=W9Y7V6_9EURO|nr:uncharacterized protein A1O1_06088 [Capronia coronata CBS 617.96]EXJ85720.1 hypothetical protein A1O1_06088 [Capronia coronata CBS 617.96]